MPFLKRSYEMENNAEATFGFGRRLLSPLMPVTVALVTDEQDGNMQSGKTHRHTNVVVDAGTRLSSRRRRRATYRELNDAWNLGIPRQSYIIKRVYDIPRLS